MTLHLFPLYCLICLVTVLSPGPAVLLALTNGINAGWRRAVISSLGNISGLLVLSTLSNLGLGATLQTSAHLFTWIKLIGASYLIFLGVRQWFSPALRPAFDESRTAPAKGRGRTFREGFFVAVTNPKAVLFLTALFPQFILPAQPLLPQCAVLTATLMAFSLSALVGYALVASLAKARLLRVMRSGWYNRCAGATFVFLGIGMLRVRLQGR